MKDKTIFDRIQRELGKYSVTIVADYAEVDRHMLYNWLRKSYANPRISELTKVANAMGFDIVLERKEK